MVWTTEVEAPADVLMLGAGLAGICAAAAA